MGFNSVFKGLKHEAQEKLFTLQPALVIRRFF